jgi:hypothetical protein
LKNDAPSRAEARSRWARYTKIDLPDQFVPESDCGSSNELGRIDVSFRVISISGIAAA